METEKSEVTANTTAANTAEIVKDVAEADDKIEQVRPEADVEMEH